MQPHPVALPSFSPQTLAVLTPLRTGAARSRAELAAHTGLSPSTVTARIDPLIAAGVVVEDGSDDSRGGRRPRRLAVRGGLGTVGSIDLGVERSTIGLVDYAGTALAHRHLVLDLAEGPDAVLRRVADELAALVQAKGTPPLTGAAIALPGPVSAETADSSPPRACPGGTTPTSRRFSRRHPRCSRDRRQRRQLHGRRRARRGRPRRPQPGLHQGGHGIGSGRDRRRTALHRPQRRRRRHQPLTVPGAAPVPCRAVASAASTPSPAGRPSPAPRRTRGATCRTSRP